MFRSRHRARLGLAIAALLLAACGAGSAAGPDAEYQRLEAPGTVEPASALEREVLAELPEMSAGERVELTGGAATAGGEYAAASGRPCRELTLEPGGERPETRLVCRIDGAWAFVPDVVAPEAPAGEPSRAPRSVSSDSGGAP